MPLIVLAVVIGLIGVEIAGFISVGEWLGLWPTLAITLTTAAIGMSLLRHQGLAALRRVQEAVEEQRTPLPDVLEGLVLLIAGALLLVPGFFSDSIGFILFLPPARKALLFAIVGRMRAAHGRAESSGGKIIDGAFVDLGDPTPPGDPRRLPTDHK